MTARTQGRTGHFRPARGLPGRAPNECYEHIGAWNARASTLISRTPIRDMVILGMKILSVEGGTIRAAMGARGCDRAAWTVDFSIGANIAWLDRRERRACMQGGRFTIIDTDAGSGAEQDHEKLRHAFRLLMKQQGAQWADNISGDQGGSA